LPICQGLEGIFIIFILFDFSLGGAAAPENFVKEFFASFLWLPTIATRGASALLFLLLSY